MPRHALAPVLLAAALAAPPAPRLARHTLVVDGRTREYYVHRPARLRAPAPTLLVLHGGGGGARQIAAQAGFDAIAEREGVVVVYPDGVDRGWNDGRPTRLAQSTGEQVDDVAFVRALLDTLTARGVADRRRVAVTGVSNGGMMTLRLACELSDRVAAAVPIVASMPVVLPCRPSRSVPLLMMNGTADPLVRFGGGAVGRGSAAGGTRPVMETVALWRDANGCPAAPATSRLPDRAPDDGVRTEVLTYAPCRGGAEVVLYRMEGAGHGLPGHPPAGRGRGARAGLHVTTDFDGSEAAWAFARRFTR